MNMFKVRKSASNVNYIKPELEMLEMEAEGSLLLTASVEKQTTTFSLTPSASSYSRQGSAPQQGIRRK